MKIILVIASLSFALALFPNSSVIEQHPGPENPPSELKIRAFSILKNTCNICHERKNKRRVFTLENMDDYGKKIHKQVFIKKRMPKGDDIKLSKAEYRQLKGWLASLGVSVVQ